VFRSLATPLTNAHYVGATRGCIYGTEKSLSQVGLHAFSPLTEIEGLVLCGASTAGQGVLGGVLSGLMAARSVLGCRASELLDPGNPSLRVYPADRLDLWPADLRSKVSRRASRPARSAPRTSP